MVILDILNASLTRFTRNFQGIERRLQQILLLNLNPSNQTNFIILVLWTSNDQTSLDFLSRSQPVVDECGNSSFNNKNPTNVTSTSSYSFILKLDSNQDRIGSFDHLNLIVSSCSKIPRAPTISQVLSFQNKPYYTFTSKPPINLTQMMTTTTTALEIVTFFHHFAFTWSFKCKCQTSYSLSDIHGTEENQTLSSRKEEV